MKRRTFIKAAAAAAAAPYVARAVGAGDKIRMGFIGIGNRGSQLLQSFMRMPDVDVVALCDVYEPYLRRDHSAIDPKILEYCSQGGKEPWFIPNLDEKFDKQPRLYHDYRKLLEDKDVDAVCIATPDHWHALQLVDSVRAGKDVYCEKPLTATVAEGRFMVNEAEKARRVVAVGIQRRASESYKRLKAHIDSGKYGKLLGCRHFWAHNYGPFGVGRCAPCEPSPGLDWDAWLGPRAWRGFRYTLAPYMFRWNMDFSNQLANQGVHSLDAFLGMMGETAPKYVTAAGGRRFLKDDGNVPDTMFCVWEFADGRTIEFTIHEAGGAGLVGPRDLEFILEEGAAYYNGSSQFRIVPSKGRLFRNPREPKFEEVKETFKDTVMCKDNSFASATDACVRNFLDCVKSRATPVVSLEDGHRSTTMAHIANIACRLGGGRLEWDGKAERFTGHLADEANKFLSYEYREGYRRYPGLGC